MDKDNTMQVMQILPVVIRKRFSEVFKDLSDVQEIRLRAGRPVIILYGKSEYFFRYKRRPYA